MGKWLEWRASHERTADLVETCVAASWLTGRWPQTVAFVNAVVHPDRTEHSHALDDVASAATPVVPRVEWDRPSSSLTSGQVGLSMRCRTRTRDALSDSRATMA